MVAVAHLKLDPHDETLERKARSLNDTLAREEGAPRANNHTLGTLLDRKERLRGSYWLDSRILHGDRVFFDEAAASFAGLV